MESGGRGNDWHRKLLSEQCDGHIPLADVSEHVVVNVETIEGVLVFVKRGFVPGATGKIIVSDLRQFFFGGLFQFPKVQYAHPAQS